MGLTRIQIVTEVLELAQLDSSFNAKGRRWLNIVLRDLALKHNFKFYNKTITTAFITGQLEYDLPAVFMRSDSAYVVNSDGVQGKQIWLVEPYVFDPYRLSAQGLPSVGMIDLNRRKIIFNMAPGSGTTDSFRLRYFIEEGDYSEDDTDDDETLIFEDQKLLIEETLKYAMKWRDDERYPQQAQDALQEKRLFMRNQYESEGTSRMDLDQQNFRRRTRR